MIMTIIIKLRVYAKRPSYYFRISFVQYLYLFVMHCSNNAANKILGLPDVYPAYGILNGQWFPDTPPSGPWDTLEWIEVLLFISNT